MKLASFELLYFILVSIDLIAQQYQPGLRLITKPLIMSSLLIWYITRAGSAQKPIIITALIFALVGDIFLLFDFPVFFQLGIAAFLVMQICYSICFKKFYQKPDAKKMAISLLVFSLAVLFNACYKKEFGQMMVPVMVYSVAIVMMAYLGINQIISNYILIGALLFVLSDFCLAFHKFVSPGFVILPAVVMISYALAQYFIVKGLLPLRTNH